VDFFFQEYYQSATEPLPQSSQHIQRQSGDDADVDAQANPNNDADILQKVNGHWGPWLNHGDRLNGDDDDEYDPDRPIIDTTHMFTLASDGAVVGLPVRFMQHSTLWAVYWQFLGHWEALQTSGRLEVAEKKEGSTDINESRSQAVSTFIFNVPEMLAVLLAALPQVPQIFYACSMQHLLQAAAGHVRTW